MNDPAKINIRERENPLPLEEVKDNAAGDRTPTTEGKTILIMMAVLVGILILIVGGTKVYTHLTAADVVNIDEQHQKNLQGELDKEEGYIYNGYSFVYADGLWWTELNKFGTLLKVPLHFGPKELESVPIAGQLDSAFNDKEEIFIAINPNVRDKYYTLAISELSFNVVKGLDRTPVGSCTEENWACENRTIVSCNNTQGKAVIELSLHNETGIEFSGTCINVHGREYELVKAVDRLLYRWYGVMR